MNLLRIEKLPEDIYSRAKSGARYFGDSLVLQVPYQTLLCVIPPWPMLQTVAAPPCRAKACMFVG